jgi:hypothetical protein
MAYQGRLRTRPAYQRAHSLRGCGMS